VAAAVRTAAQADRLVDEKNIAQLFEQALRRLLLE
jgi:hypothetical protein